MSKFSNLFGILLTGFFAILCGIASAAFPIFIGHYLTTSIAFGPNSTAFSEEPITSVANVALLNCVLIQITVGFTILCLNFIMVNLIFF